MSPESGAVLMDQIAPRLKAAVPYIRPVGCEDKEELYQDGLCMAARLLEANEQKGKTVPASSVAYYTILHLKSGRRSHSAARTDVYGSGTQLDGKTALVSTETEVGYDPETMEAIRLGEFLACHQNDPSTLLAATSTGTSSSTPTITASACCSGTWRKAKTCWLVRWSGEASILRYGCSRSAWKPSYVSTWGLRR